jgi:hypothetical protein
MTYSNLNQSDADSHSSDSRDVLDDQSLEFLQTAASVDDLLSLKMFETKKVNCKDFLFENIAFDECFNIFFHFTQKLLVFVNRMLFFLSMFLSKKYLFFERKLFKDFFHYFSGSVF